MWATVKRRRCRMLLFTSNFLKKQGEFLGELRGEIFGDVGLFPGSLGSSSSRCICSLKVLMQTSGSEAASCLQESFAVMSQAKGAPASTSRNGASSIAGARRRAGGRRARKLFPGWPRRPGWAWEPAGGERQAAVTRLHRPGCAPEAAPGRCLSAASSRVRLVCRLHADTHGIHSVERISS